MLAVACYLQKWEIFKCVVLILSLCAGGVKEWMQTSAVCVCVCARARVLTQTEKKRLPCMHPTQIPLSGKCIRSACPDHAIKPVTLCFFLCYCVAIFLNCIPQPALPRCMMLSLGFVHAWHCLQRHNDGINHQRHGQLQTHFMASFPLSADPIVERAYVTLDTR